MDSGGDVLSDVVESSVVEGVGRLRPLVALMEAPFGGAPEAHNIGTTSGVVQIELAPLAKSVHGLTPSCGVTTLVS